MDPVSLAIITGAAGTALSNAGKLLPSQLAQQNEIRLAKLKRREEMGALGLTEQEQAAMESRLSQPAQRAQESADFERKRLLAGSGNALGGQALEQAMAGEQQLMRARTEVAGKVLEADLAEQEREMDEMRALEAAKEQRRQEIIGAIGGIAGAGVEAGLGTMAQQAIVQGGKDISPEALRGLSSSMGISEDEARGIYELSRTNPEMINYMTLLNKKKQ
jgi:hypothetical protein